MPKTKMQKRIERHDQETIRLARRELARRAHACDRDEILKGLWDQSAAMREVLNGMARLKRG